MRLLMLLPQSLESPSGLGRYLPMAESLVAAGHEVEIVALHHDWTRLPTANRTEQVNGVQVRYVGQMQVLKRNGTKVYFSPVKLMVLMAQAMLAFGYHGLRGRYDLMLIAKAQPMNGLAGWLAARLRGRPIWLDSDDHEAASNRFSSSWQRRIVDMIERWLPQHADLITTNTSDSFQRINGRVPSDKLSMLRNGWSRSRFSDMGVEQSKEPLVLYVGTLSMPSHPVHLLIEAWPQVLAHAPTARLQLVGAGEERERLEAQVHRLGIADSVTFVGAVPPNEVATHYGHAWLTVEPICNDEVARGRSPLKLFESMAMGRPVVTGDVGDRALIVGEAGRLVEAGSPTALAAGICELLQQRDGWRELTQAQAEAFEWNRQVAALMPIIEKVIDG